MFGHEIQNIRIAGTATGTGAGRARYGIQTRYPGIHQPDDLTFSGTAACADDVKLSGFRRLIHNTDLERAFSASGWLMIPDMTPH